MISRSRASENGRSKSPNGCVERVQQIILHECCVVEGYDIEQDVLGIRIVFSEPLDRPQWGVE